MASTHQTAPQTLTLYVSNQSFADESVGITISIDDGVVVDDAFVVEDQHNWITFEVSLPAGEHEMVMESSTGVEQRASLMMPSGRPLWAAVDYWYSAADAERLGSGSSARHFTMTVSDEPIYFA